MENPLGEPVSFPNPRILSSRGTCASWRLGGHPDPGSLVCQQGIIQPLFQHFHAEHILPFLCALHAQGLNLAWKGRGWHCCLSVLNGILCSPHGHHEEDVKLARKKCVTCCLLGEDRGKSGLKCCITVGCEQLDGFLGWLENGEWESWIEVM